ncbi:MAG: HEAT repeat domain-containing protein [Candidatus Moduliflexus flocculans]|nr:HEAT repeat domain-containing protein [Candidatus Moduliflexus flocculans]
MSALADPARPGLAREIVAILARIPDHKGLPHLSTFLNFQNREVKLEVVHALGRIRDEMANRILLGFLKDPDEEIRIQAAMKLDPGGGRGPRPADPARGFGARVPVEEPERERGPPVLPRPDPLPRGSRLPGPDPQQGPLFGSKKVLDMRLAAVSGLESMATEEASVLLQKGPSGGPRPSARPVRPR